METEIKIVEHLLEIQELVGKRSFTKIEIIDIIKQVDTIVYNNSEHMCDIKKDFASKEPYETFLNIMSKITETKTTDKYPCWVFYMVGDLNYIQHNKKYDDFHIRNIGFWEVFEKEYNLKYQVIKELLHSLLEEHLNCKIDSIYKLLDVSCKEVEEEFKGK